VTEMASFVFCNQNTSICQCLPSFDGNATSTNKCRCPADKRVYFPSFPLSSGSLASDGTWSPANWGFKDPICIDLFDLLALDTAEMKNQKHLAHAHEFFDNTIGIVRPLSILNNPSLVFNILDPTKVKSRLSPAGEFNGLDGVIEYFYGFVASPSLNVTFVRYISESATGNTVGMKVDLWLKTDAQAAFASGGHPPVLWNLTLFTFFTFGDDDRIISIDVSVPNLGHLLDIPETTLVPLGPGGTLIPARAVVAGGTCNLLTKPDPRNGGAAWGTCGNHSTRVWQVAPYTAASFATGGINTQDAQFNRCVAFILGQSQTQPAPFNKTIPWGSKDRNNADNSACRQVHSTLTIWNPTTHCPHTGPSGGGACIFFPYESYYNQDY
jgi:hypothetical protein